MQRSISKAIRADDLLSRIKSTLALQVTALHLLPQIYIFVRVTFCSEFAGITCACWETLPTFCCLFQEWTFLGDAWRLSPAGGRATLGTQFLISQTGRPLGSTREIGASVWASAATSGQMWNLQVETFPVCHVLPLALLEGWMEGLVRNWGLGGWPPEEVQHWRG